MPQLAYDMPAKADTVTDPQQITGAVASARVTESGFDAAAGTSTVYSVAVGDSFDGRIGTNGDVDWVSIDLVAGQTYVFTLYGRGGSTAGIDDTFLAVYNSAGGQLTSNDDVNGTNNRFSAVTFTPTTSGTYYIASSAFGSETGTYTLQTATNVYTADQVANELTDFYWGWPTPISFDVSSGGSISVNISGLTIQGQRLALQALEAWTYATGITFTITTATNAQITIDDQSSGAYAGPDFVSPVTGIINASSVNIGTGWLSSYGTQLNTYSFSTYIHEIGHALGLGHAGIYDGSASYPNSALYLNDSTQMTVMSYFDARQNTYIGGSYWEPVTPMIADILAMQKLYGVPSSVYGGNTVWGANSNVGGYLGRIFSYVFDGATPDTAYWSTTGTANKIGFTIYDSGGTDLLDVSTYSGAQVIDLRPEAVSNIAGSVGNVVIMRGTIIENAKSGAGADRITGNDAGNVLEGGRGNDTIDGGAGTDTAVINATFASVTVTAVSGGYRIVSSDGTDTFTNVEMFRFNDQTVAAANLLGTGPVPVDGGPDRDMLSGSSANDFFRGFGGNDRLEGQAGNDTLDGGDGDDQILGGDGHDSLIGGDGNDTISASNGNDSVYGGTGDDSLGGGNGSDLIYGGADNDTIGGGPGDDTMSGDDGNDNMSGGYGNDSVYGGNANDTMAGSYGADQVFGGAGNDSLGGGDGADTIFGGAGLDTIGGGNDADLIYGEGEGDFIAGGNGNDTIYGGSGNDTINGGADNDSLYGGSGTDQFVFNLRTAPVGVDTIADFENGLDHIRIIGVAGASNADRYAALDISGSGSTVTIIYGEQTIIVEGVSVSAIDASDFLFV